MKTRSVLDHMRDICLALPETRETLTWAEPHFRVGASSRRGRRS